MVGGQSIHISTGGGVTHCELRACIRRLGRSALAVQSTVCPGKMSVVGRAGCLEMEGL